jgi:hypothetical protein
MAPAAPLPQVVFSCWPGAGRADGARGGPDETWHDANTKLDADSDANSDLDLELQQDLTFNPEAAVAPPNTDEERWIPYRCVGTVGIRRRSPYLEDVPCCFSLYFCLCTPPPAMLHPAAPL